MPCRDSAYTRYCLNILRTRAGPLNTLVALIILHIAFQYISTYVKETTTVNTTYNLLIPDVLMGFQSVEQSSILWHVLPA